MKALLRLYPRVWRDRYELEVARMIDDEPSAGPRLALDLVRGALDAHLHPEPLGLPGHQVRGWLSRDQATGLIAVMLGIAWAIPYLTIAITTMPWTPNPDLFPLVMTAVLTTWVAPMLLALLWGRVTGAGRRVLSAAAVGLAAVGSGGMVVTLASGAMAPYPQMYPRPDGFMTLGTAMVLAGTLLGAVALWNRGPVSRRALAGLAFASGLDLAFHIVYRDIGFQMAVESTIGALLGASVGVAWVSVGRSAMRQPTAAFTADGASSIALA